VPARLVVGGPRNSGRDVGAAQQKNFLLSLASRLAFAAIALGFIVYALCAALGVAANASDAT